MDRTMTLLLWTSLLLSYLYAFHIAAYPKGSKYTVINENCPGAEWNIMCRDCCEYDQVECTCPGGNKKVGYTIPCCRNEDHECDSCLIHPGCTIFDNCKSCYNGSWGGTLDDFYVKGKYCSECRIGWYGGDCMRCGEVIQAARGEIMMESYPFNAHCEWSIQVTPGYTIELRRKAPTGNSFLPEFQKAIGQSQFEQKSCGFSRKCRVQKLQILTVSL